MSTVTVDSVHKQLYLRNEYGTVHQNPDAQLDQQSIKFLEENFKINTSLHSTCINCQARQMLKYGNKLDKDGKYVKEFTVPCKGIPKSLPPGSATLIDQIVKDQGIDREIAIKTVKASVDPVAWAELMFGFSDDKPKWCLRSYQKEQLRCTAQNLVVREGRRSGKTFMAALKLLYLIFNREILNGYGQNGKPLMTGPRVMIITPYQSQILNIFDEMERLLKLNPELKSQLTTGSGGSLYVKTPYFHMDFLNGGTISGFVSGVGTKVDGSGGGTMRGQNAHIIYLDEMDMIPEETIEKVVLPILLTDQGGEVMLMATSTPIGKRGKFYKWCLESPNFKEDHLPSTLLPQWDKMKALLETENSEESMRAEYMAEFIDSTYGVFKSSLVYAALKDYEYQETTGQHFWTVAGVRDPSKLITTIGIDWNKNAGTEFCVTAYDMGTNKYFVLETVNISAGEFSSVKWKEEVIRLNYKYNPEYIYADEGYGHTIIEDLKLLAMELARKPNKNAREIATVRLSEVIKSYNFSSNIELRSPLTGQVITKSGKEFLVENAIRVFEDQAVWLSIEDQTLVKELLHYVVLSRSKSTNKPVYGADSAKIGDHRLDAFMLSLAGPQLENGLYSKNTSYGPVGVAGFVPRVENDNQPLTLAEQLTKAQTTFGGTLSVLQIVGGRPPEEEPGRNREIRSRIPMGEKSVYQDYKERVKSNRGWDTDDEHLYNKDVDTGGFIQPRSGGKKRRSLFGRAI